MKRKLASVLVWTALLGCGARSELLDVDLLLPEAGAPQDEVDAAVPTDVGSGEGVQADATASDSGSYDAAQEADALDASDGSIANDAADAGDANDAADASDADGSRACHKMLGAYGAEQLSVSPAPYPWTSNGLAVQADGNILVLGFPNAGSPAAAVALARYDVDGALDSAFGTSGIATITPPQSQDWPAAVAIQNDGKILVATLIEGGLSYVARLSTSGVLDTSFGNGGFAVAPPAARIWGLAARPDGSIVAIGDMSDGALGVFLTRFTSAGVIDTSFGTGGFTTTLIPSSYRATVQRVAFQADGAMVVAGRTVAATANGGPPLLVRYTANGILDPTFGTGGIVLPAYVPGHFYNVNAVLVQSTGGIVAAIGDDYSGLPDSFTLQRFTSTGALDTTFGTNGTTVTNFFSVDVASLAGDALMVGGTVQVQGASTITLAQYTANGALDTAFADGGMAVANFPGETQNSLIAVALGPQGIVLDGLGMTGSDGGGQPLLDLGLFRCP